MSTLNLSKKPTKEELGKLEKVFAVVKKIASKELIWFLVVIVVSIPIALIGFYWVTHYAPKAIQDAVTIAASPYPSYLTLYVISGAGIYFSRIVAMALKNANKK